MKIIKETIKRQYIKEISKAKRKNNKIEIMNYAKKKKKSWQPQTGSSEIRSTPHQDKQRITNRVAQIKM